MIEAAHDDEARRQKLKLSGLVLSADTLEAWRITLTELAIRLDQSVTKQIEFPDPLQQTPRKAEP